MTSRPPLDPSRLPARPPWTSVTVLDEVDSTNLAAVGRPPGSVLVAEKQVAGRGRLDRSWVSPPGAGLTFSVVLRPSAATSTWGWLPLLAGLALTDVIEGAALKWPNDLLLGPQSRKAAGILAQASGPDVIVGIGLNVSTAREELPVDSATSLALEGRVHDRTELLDSILTALGRRFDEWQAADGSGPIEDYRARCATLGQDVRVHGVDGTTLIGRATDVDAAGRLLVDVAGVEHAVAAGDVEHVRGVTP
jgi:BirA family transcriptional regulator, biotin operon repressor / biotin---[acetyl-CoA-carboxylase] ligase